MRKIINEVWTNTYSESEWLTAKLAIMYVWLFITLEILFIYKSAPFPQGIFTFDVVANIENSITNYILMLASVIFCAMYLYEKMMRLTTLAIFIISVFAFSLEESNGILNRYGLLSMVFFVQFLAYQLAHYYKSLNHTQLRFLFSIQVITGGYILSGLSKLLVSGFDWISNSKYLSLQIIKSHYYNYLTYGNPQTLEIGEKYAQFAQQNTVIIQTLLTTSIVLELFAWISIGNKKRAIIYGSLLMLMHTGISILMDIKLVGISRPMFIFMVNPLFIIWIGLIRPTYIKFKKK
jgi:hypothetical protein